MGKTILECPKCGCNFKMTDPDEWECPECGHGGEIIWNGDEIDYLTRDTFDIDEIREDPENNKPLCCMSCDNPCYPDCIDSCRIFED